MNESSDGLLKFKAEFVNARTLNELLDIKIPSIRKKIQDDNLKNEIDEYEQIASIICDVRCFLESNKINDLSKFLCRAYFSHKRQYLFFISNLNNTNIEQLKDLEVYGFWGKYSNNTKTAGDYFYMELGVKLNCRDTPIEIKTINAGIEKRCGRGSLGIKFLEEVLIPEINKILEIHGHKENIGYIYGISADLCEDTNALARAKFYCRNDFKMINSHFYKSVK